MKSIYLLALVFILSSCTFGDKYQNVETFSLDDFKVVRELEGKMLEFDSLIMHPTELRVFDSLLITVNYDCEKMLHIFNLNTRKQVNQCLLRGQGPNEMLQPRFVGNDKSKVLLFDVATSKVMEYEITDLLKNSSSVPCRQAQLQNKIFICANQIGTQFLGCSHQPDYQIYTFGLDGALHDKLIPYPASSISYSDVEKVDAYYMRFTTNEKDKLALCYCMTDLIEIYGLDGTLIKRLQGPDYFFTYFKEVHNGEVVTSSPDTNRLRDAYFSPCNIGDSFLVLYNGNKPMDKSYSYLCKELFGFSWDGIPQTRYLLSDAIFAFDVDVKHHKIYGISDSPEYHIVEYNY